MPPRIQQLPTLVINQIAAGEVIERPASVVKELLENSVDAGARRLEIDVEQGGHDLVRVVDDGCGIAPEDLPLAFASHATSKLHSADDLFSIGTFGFRGEALASIGGVAQVVLQSRPPDQTIGAMVECKGSELTPVRPWSGAAGTRIEVRQLFFNTPVRRKFLRTPGTEMGHISETVTRLALAHPRLEDHPGLHLVLRHNGKMVSEAPATAHLLDRISLFFGAEVAGQLYPLECEAGRCRLSGFIADPQCNEGHARRQYLFLNGRWIRDRSLMHALQEGYQGLLMKGRYAVAFLFLDVPPEQVDVNVHPTKSEVRFRDAQGMYRLVFTAVKRCLNQANLTARMVPPASTMPPPRPEPFRVVRPPEEPVAMREIPEPPPLPRQEPEVIPPVRQEPVVPRAPERPPLTLTAFPPAREVPRIIQLYDTYLVVETEEGMLVIDQHALHERILYEQFRNRILAGTLQTQEMLIPEPVDLTSDACARVLEQRTELANLGLGVEDFGGGTILLTRYPVLLGRRSPRALLQGVVDHLMSQDRAPSREVLFNDLLSLMACHSAVRAGERLSQEMMAELIAQRRLADDHHHCPHGRPTALLFTRGDLERQFRRA